MSNKVIILGAKGRFGRAAVDAFLDAGWQVRAFARSWKGETTVTGVEQITGDAFDAKILAEVASGCDVIVNALNPPYPRWRDDLPRLTASVIHAAKKSGASVMIPGNVYNYGAGMPELLSEDTPHEPTARKGRLREEMETSYANASNDGVQTMILRAGDFIERQKTGNWFDSHIAANIGKGRVMYPAALDRLHAWAYLPDSARAMVGLAEKRNDFSNFEQFGFAGYELTGLDLIKAMEKASGRTLRVKSLPWSMVRILGLIMPQMREVVEMRYLWDTPHSIDGEKLAQALPDFEPTPLSLAIADALGGDSANTITQDTMSDSNNLTVASSV